LQETYQRALAAKRKPPAAHADEIRPWMFTIMRHAWQNELRRISRSRETWVEHASGVVSGDDVELAMGRKLLVSEVRAAVDALPAPWREMIVLRDIEDLSYARIAGILGCPVGTVMSRLARARSALRQLLQQRAPVVRG
jgi:RNA polymerase sigma-70 factor (ECF subfamily)